MECAPSYVAANQAACGAEERGGQRRKTYPQTSIPKPRKYWLNSDKELNSTLLLLADGFRCAEQEQKSEGILDAFAFCFNFLLFRSTAQTVVPELYP